MQLHFYCDPKFSYQATKAYKQGYRIATLSISPAAYLQTPVNRGIGQGKRSNVNVLTWASTNAIRLMAMSSMSITTEPRASFKYSSVRRNVCTQFHSRTKQGIARYGAAARWRNGPLGHEFHGTLICGF